MEHLNTAHQAVCNLLVGLRVQERFTEQAAEDSSMCYRGAAFTSLYRERRTCAVSHATPYERGVPCVKRISIASSPAGPPGDQKACNRHIRT